MVFCLVRIKKQVIVAVLCVVLALTGAVYATAVAAQSDRVELPIVMYHSVLKDSSYWGKYVISPKEFESDLQYLKANGYTAIGQKELSDYVNKGVPLPEKPVMLTFDDGYYNNYLYAYPLAVQYEMKIIISPIGFYSDQYSGEEKLSGYYSHCTWEQISEMTDSGFVEFGNHTYNLHKSDGVRLGTTRLPGEDLQDYEALLKNDLGSLQEKLMESTGVKSEIFTYPFGAVSEDAPGIVDSVGFPVTLTCEEKVNTITRDADSLKMLGRFLRVHDQPIKKYLEEQ